MKLLNLDQGSEEWKQERRRWATASDMPSILKIPGAFISRKKLLEHKLGEEKELTPYQSQMFARGHEIEAELRVWAEQKLGMKFEPCVILDEELGILASIDCVNFEHGVIVETKNSWAKGKLEMARNYEVWEPYRVQILTQMLLAKIDLAFMVMRDDTNGEIHMIAVEPDEKITGQIIEESAKFVKELREAEDL